MQIRDASGTLRTITGIAMRDAGGVLRPIKMAKARDAGSTLRVVFSGMKVTVSPDEATGFASTGGDRAVVTSGVSATVTGGTAPYTYAWTPSAGWSATSPALASTAFVSPDISPGDSSTGDAYVTVTDANGQTAVSNDITLYAANGGWDA